MNVQENGIKTALKLTLQVSVRFKSHHQNKHQRTLADDFSRN